MKTLKITLILLLFISFTNNVLSQEVVKKKTRKERKAERKKANHRKTTTYKVKNTEKVEKKETTRTIVDAYTESQTLANQNKLTCKLFSIIFQNYSNKYAYLTGKLIDDDSLFKTYYYKKQMPNRFIAHYIDKKNGVFNLTAYKGADKEKAEQKFIEIYNWLTQDCFDFLDKEFTFLKDDKKNYLKTSKRDYFLTTTTDNILIKIKFNKSLEHKNGKFVTVYQASISFIGLKDKQKVISKILKTNN